MNQATIRDVTTVPRIAHDEAMRIAAVENTKFAGLVASFEPGDWTKPTDCVLWDVRALAAHVVGSAAGQASPREFVRQVRKGRPLVAEIGGKFWWDGMNELQVRERTHLSTQELVAEWGATSARALRARTRLPRPIARLPLLKLPAPVGRQPLSYLFDVGFTRDVWMHRIDLARATAKTLDVDSDHDGRIVADLVAEWASTHREPFTLTLGGPAGGQFRAGTGGEEVDMGAIEFCRILAERGHGTGILRHSLPL
ncbi:MAG TPA: maleylpyruvate isomerase family mycothiol-dependent enzyme [Acidimicrobiales bacterium]|nr:maleylpyruvate isomerase family mycothiol-dependent enzyme [Acidimicrobiales bacterium]